VAEGTEAPVVNQTLFFTLEKQEEFRFSLPFDAPGLFILIRAGGEIKPLHVRRIKEDGKRAR
jgi:hypothetical protein